MAYPKFTAQDISVVTGNPVESYPDFANEALLQATLLFKMGTCLADFPTEPMDAQLARYAILHMADAIVQVQPFQEALYSPFSSESIGSYSYGKLARAAQAGLPTGVSWFDMALEQLSVCSNEDVMSSGTEIFEFDGIFAPGVGGNNRLVSPALLNNERVFHTDPTDKIL